MDETGRCLPWHCTQLRPFVISPHSVRPAVVLKIGRGRLNEYRVSFRGANQWSLAPIQRQQSPYGVWRRRKPFGADSSVVMQHGCRTAWPGGGRGSAPLAGRPCSALPWPTQLQSSPPALRWQQVSGVSAPVGKQCSGEREEHLGQLTYTDRSLTGPLSCT